MKMIPVIGIVIVAIMLTTVLTAIAQELVDLNSAVPSQLEKLYRVSPKLAVKIIMEREKNGPFVSLEDVAVRIKEIGPKTIAKWDGMAVVIPPTE